MVNRKPNIECAKCGKPIYRRPFEIERYSNLCCSRECKAQIERREHGKTICPVCESNFSKSKPSQIYCSKKCSGFRTRNRKNDGVKHKRSNLIAIIK